MDKSALKMGANMLEIRLFSNFSTKKRSFPHLSTELSTELSTKKDRKSGKFGDQSMGMVDYLYLLLDSIRMSEAGSASVLYRQVCLCISGQ